MPSVTNEANVQTAGIDMVTIETYEKLVPRSGKSRGYQESTV